MSMAVDAVAASRIFEASSSRCASRTSCCRCQVSYLFGSQRLTYLLGGGKRSAMASECLVSANWPPPGWSLLCLRSQRRFDTACGSPMVSAQASGGTGQGTTALRWFGVWDSGFNLGELQL
jgi:hypothetical protein